MPVNATHSVYDVFNVTDSGNLLEFVQGVNHLTGDRFMLLVLLAGFIILFVSMHSPVVNSKDAFVASGFITAVLAIFFTTLGFIQTNVMILIVLIYGALFAFIAIKKN